MYHLHAKLPQLYWAWRVHGVFSIQVGVRPLLIPIVLDAMLESLVPQIELSKLLSIADWDSLLE